MNALLFSDNPNLYRYRLRALRNRNYRLFFMGQNISMMGTWMQTMAQGWLVYRLTQSGYWLGFIAFAAQFIAFLICPLAGVVADRFNRGKVLLLVSIVSMVQAFLLAALTFLGRVEIWHIALLSGVLGVANAFEITTRHAFAADLVNREDISSAITLNSTSINGSRVIGPAVAGILLRYAGEGWCFLLNALSFLAVIACLFMMRFNEPRLQPRTPLLRNFWSEYRAAMIYVRANPRILRLLSVAGFVGFVGSPYFVYLPVFAKTVLGGDTALLGWLTGMAGLGGVVGVLNAGGANSAQGLAPKLRKDIALLGLAMIVLGISRSVPLSLAATFLIGHSLMAVFPMVNSTIQEMVSDSMRGRVLSLYTMTFMGTFPFGSYLAGWAGDLVGAPTVMAFNGISCLVFAAALGMRHRLVAIPTGYR